MFEVPRDSGRLRSPCGAICRGAVGLEHELLVVRRDCLPVDASDVVTAVADPRVKLEQPAYELEIALSRTERASDLGSRYREVVSRQVVSSSQVHHRLHDLVNIVEPDAAGDLDDVRTMVGKPLVEGVRTLGPVAVVPRLAEVLVP
ncbi:hypothetical protein [Kribbella sp. NPDC049584]|uniref:hypothetical protein n=1 Tax=Kribbella sp. NPDC049584 TaxID=3154833 RepID=UPI003445B703